MRLSLNVQRGVYGTLIIGLIVTIAASVYYLLGGFDRVIVYEGESEKNNVVGRYFAGKPDDPKLKEMLRETTRLLREGALTGEFVVVNYDNDSLEGNELGQFIGVALEGGMAEIPPGFEVLEMPSSGTLAVYLSMHPLVRPTPRTIEKMFDAYAQEHDIVLGEYTLETHFSDNSMSVEAMVVE